MTIKSWRPQAFLSSTSSLIESRPLTHMCRKTPFNPLCTHRDRVCNGDRGAAESFRIRHDQLHM
jgi:hypothetical protein